MGFISREQAKKALEFDRKHPEEAENFNKFHRELAEKLFAKQISLAEFTRLHDEYREAMWQRIKNSEQKMNSPHKCLYKQDEKCLATDAPQICPMCHVFQEWSKRALYGSLTKDGKVMWRNRNEL
jgi:hypothetical protein